jgi:hypothetical protein
MLHKDYESKYSGEKKKMLVVILNGLVAKNKLIGGKQPVVKLL